MMVPVSMSMNPGTPMPMPARSPDAAMLGGQRLDGVAHLADDEVAAQLNFGSGGHLLQHLAFAADGGDAQVGPTKIDCYGKNAHEILTRPNSFHHGGTEITEPIESDRSFGISCFVSGTTLVVPSATQSNTSGIL